MNILTAINNDEINQKLNEIENINVVFKDIKYKEGILEILEKTKNIEYIFLKEDLNGQIKINKLINKIKNKNNKIKIIIILNKKEKIKEKYLNKNKIKYIYLKQLKISKMLDIIKKENKIIAILGNEGTGKTITTLILSEILRKNKKILIIEDNIKNNSIINYYKINNKKVNKETIKIKNNLFIFNIKIFLVKNKKNRIKIIEKLNKIRNNFDYIFIDTQNINSYSIYKEIIDKNILILNPDIIEINKIKNKIFKIKNIKIILNNYNENSINKKIIENIFKNKIKVIEKIKNNKRYNLIINNNLNIKYLDKKTKNKYIKIINNI